MDLCRKRTVKNRFASRSIWTNPRTSGVDKDNMVTSLSNAGAGQYNIRYEIRQI